VDEFRLERELQDQQDGRRIDFRFRAVINGKQLPEVFSFCVLPDAIRKSGRYQLFTCTCGIFGCGGYWVDVECTKEAWIWKNGFYPADEDEPEEQWLMYEFDYRIPWSQVRVAMGQIREAILESRKLQPNYWIVSPLCAEPFLDFEKMPTNARG
jgi:hypothetical protein